MAAERVLIRLQRERNTAVAVMWIAEPASLPYVELRTERFDGATWSRVFGIRLGLGEIWNVCDGLVAAQKLAAEAKR